MALAAGRFAPARVADASGLLTLFEFGLFSFILGIGTEETAAICTSSRNYLKSLSGIFLPEDCYCYYCSSTLTLSLVCRFFSGVPEAEIFFGVGGLVFSFYYVLEEFYLFDLLLFC